MPKGKNQTTTEKLGMIGERGLAYESKASTRFSERIEQRAEGRKCAYEIKAERMYRRIKKRGRQFQPF
jgi:hypothetical protein